MANDLSIELSLTLLSESHTSLRFSLICPDCPDTGLSSVDSVFIFQNSVEDMESASYDAIVVEQWTIVDVSSNTSEEMCALTDPL